MGAYTLCLTTCTYFPANNFISHALVMLSTVAQRYSLLHMVCGGVYTLRVRSKAGLSDHIQLASVLTKYLVHVVHVHPEALLIYDF